MRSPAAYALRLSPARLAQIEATRDRLNRLGDRFYTCAGTAWDRHRIRLRNRMNYILMIRATEGSFPVPSSALSTSEATP